MHAQARSGWVFLAATLLITVPILVSAFLPVRPASLAVAVSALVVSAIAYIYFVSPKVTVTDESILVQNPWREHTVPWGALIDVDTRFQLTLVTPQGRVHALGAPSPGGFSAMRAKPDRDRTTREVQTRQAGGMRPGDLPGSASGSMALVIRGHWQDLVEAGTINTSEKLSTRPRVVHLAVTLGGLALVGGLWLLA